MHIINIIIQAPLGTPCKAGSDKNNNDWQNMHNFLYYENYNCTIIWLLKASAVESCEMNLLVFLKFHLFCKGFSAQAAGIMFLVFENHLVFPEIASLCECPCTKCAAEGPHTYVNKLIFLRVPLSLNDFPQELQENGFSPEWTFIWALRCIALSKDFPQTSQLTDFLTMCVFFVNLQLFEAHKRFLT